MTTPVQPYDEIQTILARNAGALADTVDRVAKAIGDRDQYELGAAQNVAAEQIGRILAYSDLLGRRRMTILAQAAEAPRVERYALAAAPAHLLGALPKGGVLPEVKFEEAVEDIASRMPMVARGWRAVAELYQTRHAFACARAMTVAVTNRVQKIMADAIRGGDALPSGDAVSEIIQATGWDRAQADVTYRTNAQTAYTAGIFARSLDPDVLAVIPGFRYVSQHLATSRPNHEAMAGLLAPTNSSVWNYAAPPAGYNCVTGDVRVSGNVEGMVRSRYSGQVVELHTRNGASLRVTANHPVLTRRGWIAARLVREGDEVFRHLPDVHALNGGDLLSPSAPLEAVGAEHNHDVPPRAEDAFDALAAQRYGGQPILADRLPLDFHGDALSTEREVHVVRSDGRLPRYAATESLDFAGDLALVLAEAASLPVHGGGAQDALLHRHGPNSRSVPSLGASTLDALPVVGSLLRERPRNPLRVGHAPRRNSAPPKPTAEDASTHAEFLRNLELGLSGDVATDRVVKVRDFHWTGHVYDLQTSEGWMVANGIVISNCVCSLSEVTVFEAEREGLIRNGEMLSLIPPGFGITGHPDPGFGGRPDLRVRHGSIV